MKRMLVVAVVVICSAGLAYAAVQQAVSQKGRLFSPGALHVKAGETLLFKNDDSVTHHIYSSTKGQEFDLETTHPGQDVKHTFTTPGRVEVRCGLHPGMRLIVTVD